MSNSLSDTVQRIDVTGQSAGAAVSVPRDPIDITLTHDGRQLLVVSFGDGSHAGSLTAIDTGSPKPGRSLELPPAPGALTLSPDGTTAYVSNHQGSAITVVDIKAWTTKPSIPLPCSPTELLVTPDGHRLYAACRDTAQVVPVDPRTGAAGAPIAVAADPRMVLSTNGQTLYVLGTHQLEAIDTAGGTIVKSQDETDNIVRVLPAPDDRTLLAIDNTGAALLVIDATTLQTTQSVSVGTRPDQVALDASGSHAYVLDTGQQKLYVIDRPTWNISATVDVSPNVTGMVAPSRRP